MIIALKVFSKKVKYELTTIYLQVKEKWKTIVRISFIFDKNVYLIYIPLENKEKAAMKKQTRTFK